MRKWRWFFISLLVLSAVLAACGSAKKKENTTPTPPASDGFNPSGAVGLNTGSSLTPTSITNTLPGCDDPSSTECPSPLTLTMDGTATQGGVTISYPSRYFTATTGSSGTPAILIEVAPSDKFKFAEKATFQVYFADSIDKALAGLSNPITGDWSNATLKGKIGVVKDETQNPPLNTIVGAFSLSDGRVIVVKLVTVGKYAWTLWSKVYEAMLNSVVVAPAG